MWSFNDLFFLNRKKKLFSFLQKKSADWKIGRGTGHTQKGKEMIVAFRENPLLLDSWGLFTVICVINVFYICFGVLKSKDTFLCLHIVVNIIVKFMCIKKCLKMKIQRKKFSRYFVSMINFLWGWVAG